MIPVVLSLAWHSGGYIGWSVLAWHVLGSLALSCGLRSPLSHLGIFLYVHIPGCPGPQAVHVGWWVGIEWLKERVRLQSYQKWVSGYNRVQIGDWQRCSSESGHVVPEALIIPLDHILEWSRRGWGRFTVGKPSGEPDTEHLKRIDWISG